MNVFQYIPYREKVDIAKNLAMMLTSGVPINEALVSLEAQTRIHSLQIILKQIRMDVEAGTSLADAFGRHDNVFDPVFISLIKTGETSGTLDENLQFLSKWLEREYNLRQELRAATLYPKIVIVLALLLGGALSIFILPRLIPLFTQLNVDLPLVTRILLAMSLFIQQYWLFIIIGIIIFIVIIIALMRVPIIKKAVHVSYLYMPIFGRLIQQYQLAIISQLLYTLMKSSIPMGTALKIVGTATTNMYYKQSFDEIHNRIIGGTKLSDAMETYSHLYPRHMITIISVSERSGTLDEALLSLSEHYSKEVLLLSKRLPTILEPLLLVAIAGVVGFIAISVILPIYQLTQGIAQ
jgi:type IV pilus assembly protein PilC